MRKKTRVTGLKMNKKAQVVSPVVRSGRRASAGSKPNDPTRWQYQRESTSSRGNDNNDNFAHSEVTTYEDGITPLLTRAIRRFSKLATSLPVGSTGSFSYIVASQCSTSGAWALPTLKHGAWALPTPSTERGPNTIATRKSLHNSLHIISL
jgi:hypothetical protein